jgi:hypothetical protein
MIISRPSWQMKVLVYFTLRKLKIKISARQKKRIRPRRLRIK